MDAITSKSPAAPMNSQAGPSNAPSLGSRIGDNSEYHARAGAQSLIANNPLAVREALLRLRRQRLVLHLHRLGPSPLGHFIREVEVATGDDVTARLERYAEIDPEFVRALGGDRFASSLHCIDGGGP